MTKNKNKTYQTKELTPEQIEKKNNIIGIIISEEKKKKELQQPIAEEDALILHHPHKRFMQKANLIFFIMIN